MNWKIFKIYNFLFMMKKNWKYFKTIVFILLKMRIKIWINYRKIKINGKTL